MAVPNYDAIEDTEIDPESALTTTLFHKLRDNPLALLGIDLTDPSPTIVVPGNRAWTKLAYSAVDYSFVVPEGTGLISYEGWGPGGIGRLLIVDPLSGTESGGSAGQYRAGMLDVTPLETLTIVIGENGSEDSTLIKRGATVLVEIKPGLNRSGGIPGPGGTGGSSTPAIGYADADMHVDGGSSELGTFGVEAYSIAFGSSLKGPGRGSSILIAAFPTYVLPTDGGLIIRY